MPTDPRKANGPASQPGVDGASAPDVVGAMSAEIVTSGELSPARLRQVIERISSGFYDRTDVQREVVRRLRSDLPPA